MATRFYFHRATHINNANMPQSDQHSSLDPTSGKIVDDFTNTRYMDSNVGNNTGANTYLGILSNASTSLQIFYYCRFASLPLALGTSGITAQTWTYAFNVWKSSANANFPVSGNNTTIPINCYVWRPSTQSKVGTILQGNSAATVDEKTVYQVDVTIVATFSGSAVSSLQDGDVIIFEVWFEVDQAAATAYWDYFNFDGANDPGTDGSQVAEPATYLETPQNISLYFPTIEMTNAWTKNLNTKFIT